MDVVCSDFNRSTRYDAGVELWTPCHVDVLNVVISIGLTVSTLLVAIYLQCKRSGQDVLQPRIQGHSLRCVLFIFIFLASLVEIADALLSHHQVLILTTSVATLVTWFATAVFYYQVETRRRTGFLLVSGVGCLAFAASRGVRCQSWYLDGLDLDWTYVRPVAAAGTATLFAGVALLDFLVLCREFRRRKSYTISEHANCEEKVIYRHCVANFFSKATFYWLTSLLRVGHANPLELDDLGVLPPPETTDRVYEKFKKVYDQEKRCSLRTRRSVSLWRCYVKSCWPMFTLGGLFKLLGDFVGFVGPFGISVIIQYVGKLTNDGLDQNTTDNVTIRNFIENGYVMSVIIFVSALAQGTFSQSSTHLVNVEGIHLKSALQALVYDKALRLCVWNIADQRDEMETVSENDMGPAIPNDGVEKMKLDKTSSNRSTTSNTDVGTITNLMSEDSLNVMTCIWIGHYIWAIPLKIGVLIYLLYLKLGKSAIVGSAICILTMTPLQFLIGKKMSTNSKAITEMSDERLRKVNEVLQGIKLLKLYGWECVYGKRISETRKNELVFLDKDSLYWALMTFLTQASSVMVTLVTFGVYFAMDRTSMTADKVFAGLALFNQLTVPLFIFPITVPIIISALLSTRRLEEFLALPETTTPALGNVDENGGGDPVRETLVIQTISSQLVETIPMISRASAFGLGNIIENEEGVRDDDDENDDDDDDDDEDDDGDESKEKKEDFKVVEDKGVDADDDDVVLSVKSGCFSWSGDNKASLSMIDVVVEAAKLTLVVGKVGSGKTSLLSALLGEMHTVGGKIHWKRGSTIAYAAQKPWLLNASVRENILFGQPYRRRRYARIIEACALQPDIDILPGKDETEIGEKGITLSGGQKQRVSIARALYTQANVVIMDDPLSALDHQVGQQVFDNGIKKLLLRQRRTVILVTHRLQLLSQAHKIVALEDGKIRAQGSLEDIEKSDADLAKTWKAIMTREALEEQAKWRTARERWQLVKLVSRVGVQLKQRNGADSAWHNEEPATVTPPTFVRLRKRLGTFSGSRYFSHDLPLPTDECDDEFVSRPVRPSIKRNRLSGSIHSNYSIGVSALPQHRKVVRTSSLQMHDGLPYRVVRQSSSPNMQNDGLPHAPCRTRNFTMDSEPQTNMFKRILSIKERRNTGSSTTESPPAKDTSVLKRLMSTPGSKPAVAASQEHARLKRMQSTASTFSDDFNDEEEYDGAGDAIAGRLISDEEREYGKIPRRIYSVYLCACGVTVGLGYVISTVVWQGLRVYTDFWLSKWTHSYNNATAMADSSCQGANPKENFRSEMEEGDQALHYLEVYAVLSIVSILLSLSSNAIGQYAGAKARRTLHDKMLLNLLRCPIRFFETTPVGRIINRFSTDMSVIDKKIATTIQRLLQFLLMVFSAILVNAVVSPWFLLLAVPICVAYFLVQRFYRNSARELQRLDNITRSPIFSHFSETLGGLSTIRAFSHQRRFTAMLHNKMDVHTNVFLVINTGNRWLGIALDYLGGVIVFVAIIVSLVTADLYPCLITPAKVGLAINYTLLVPIYLHWVVKFLSDMEVYMSAVERVEQYALTPTEDYREQGISVPLSWPEKGDIVFDGVSLRYDVGREPIVSNFSLHIPAGQKVGICGRSGSGKSSLVLSLFNMIDVFEGSILIDGVDIKQVPLQVLRSRLSIIPQDVLMFSGTIRSNLDPRAQYSDEKLWKSLELAQLKDIVSKYPGGLDGEVREGGENLSAGQKQLFCLARAILHEAACLVMDEATSSIDPATEKALLAAATRAFAARTVITIAHRLPTILDCDRIIVLDGGRVVEDGKPSQLLNRSMGIFSTMLRASEEGTLSP